MLNKIINLIIQIIKENKYTEIFESSVVIEKLKLVAYSCLFIFHWRNRKDGIINLW